MNWHEDDRRSSATEAYFTPVEFSRSNWLTLTEHQVCFFFVRLKPLVEVSLQVTKLQLTGSSAPYTAHGVTFKSSDGSGSSYKAYANREIILAAGAIQTPALLQLSGIGPSSVLGNLGITTKINLPVGSNLQEQTMNSLGAHGANGYNSNGRGPSDAIAYPNIYQVFGDAANGVVSSMSDNLASWAQSESAHGHLTKESLATIFEIQRKLIVDNHAPVVELFFDSGFPE